MRMVFLPVYDRPIATDAVSLLAELSGGNQIVGRITISLHDEPAKGTLNVINAGVEKRLLSTLCDTLLPPAELLQYTGSDPIGTGSGRSRFADSSNRRGDTTRWQERGGSPLRTGASFTVIGSIPKPGERRKASMPAKEKNCRTAFEITKDPGFRTVHVDGAIVTLNARFGQIILAYEEPEFTTDQNGDIVTEKVQKRLVIDARMSPEAFRSLAVTMADQVKRYDERPGTQDSSS